MTIQRAEEILKSKGCTPLNPTWLAGSMMQFAWPNEKAGLAVIAGTVAQTDTLLLYTLTDVITETKGN